MIGLILGFFSSFLPDIIGLFKRGQDNKHELKMLETQAKHAKELRDLDIRGELEGINLKGLFEVAISEIKATHEEQKALLAHDNKLGDEMLRFIDRVISYKPDNPWLKLIWGIGMAPLVGFVGVIMALRYGARSNSLYIILGYYGMVKYAAYQVALKSGGNNWEAVSASWTHYDYEVMGGVIGFWFGHKFKSWMGANQYIAKAR